MGRFSILPSLKSLLQKVPIMSPCPNEVSRYIGMFHSESQSEGSGPVGQSDTPALSMSKGSDAPPQLLHGACPEQAEGFRMTFARGSGIRNPPPIESHEREDFLPDVSGQHSVPGSALP